MSNRLVHSVLHPTDFSEASNRAFAQALAMSLVGNTTLTILHVGPENRQDVKWSSFPPVRKTLERWGVLKPGSPRSALSEEFQVRVKKVAVCSRTPVQSIVDHLAKDPADLVVLGTEESRGLQTSSPAGAIVRWSKSKTLFVSRRARRGVVSLRDGSGSLASILVPVDTAPDCTMAIEFARRAAHVLGDPPVTITLLHVGATLPSTPRLEDGPEWTWRRELRQGDPVAQILSAARELEADLIVMATAGHEGPLDALRGRATEQIVRDAECPVLAVPAG